MTSNKLKLFCLSFSMLFGLSIAATSQAKEVKIGDNPLSITIINKNKTKLWQENTTVGSPSSISPGGQASFPYMPISNNSRATITYYDGIVQTEDMAANTSYSLKDGIVYITSKLLVASIYDPAYANNMSCDLGQGSSKDQTWIIDITS